MDRVLQSMGEIQSPSEEISRIMGEIENITSITNLLAIIASIEAVRAGQVVKGLRRHGWSKNQRIQFLLLFNSYHYAYNLNLNVTIIYNYAN